MSFEKFLQFWTIYNRQIIEFVFVFTFVLILFIIYRQFFAKSNSAAGGDHHANPVSIDTSEIEEKLKKILENQGSHRPVKGESGSHEPANAVVSGESGKVDTQEIDRLKAELKEKEKAIEDLKKSPGSAGGAANPEDLKKFEEKIKELEGRLQEYEIISEDIADLSFYKEENARLQKELGSSKTAAVTAAPVEAPTPKAVEASAPIVTAAIPAPAAPEPAVVELKPVPAAVAPDAGTIAIAAEKKKTEEAATVAGDKVVDDDILKEFAAAVEGQKHPEPPAPAAAATIEEIDPAKLTESKELMGEFENFIKKG